MASAQPLLIPPAVVAASPFLSSLDGAAQGLLQQTLLAAKPDCAASPGELASHLALLEAALAAGVEVLRPDWAVSSGRLLVSTRGYLRVLLFDPALNPSGAAGGPAVTAADAVTEAIVEPGDSLYVPKGWGHLSISPNLRRRLGHPMQHHVWRWQKSLFPAIGRKFWKVKLIPPTAPVCIRQTWCPPA